MKRKNPFSFLMPDLPEGSDDMKRPATQEQMAIIANVFKEMSDIMKGQNSKIEEQNSMMEELKEELKNIKEEKRERASFAGDQPLKINIGNRKDVSMIITIEGKISTANDAKIRLNASLPNLVEQISNWANSHKLLGDFVVVKVEANF